MGIGAYILIAGTAAGESRSAALEQAGYRCKVLQDDPDLAAAIAAENPNVALIVTAEENGHDAIRRLKTDAKTRHIPVAAVDVGPDAKALRACYEAGADDVFEADSDVGELLARLVPLVRLSGMEAELRRRARTAEEFGIAVNTEIEIAVPDEGFRLLVVGLAPDAFDTMCPMLAKTGISYVAETDPYRARSRLTEENQNEFAGALVYVKGGEDADKAAFFCRSVRNDRRLFDLPIFVVAEEGAFHSTTEAYGQGANVLARTPIDCNFVDVHLRMLYRGRALRRALGQRIAKALDANSADKLGTVYSAEFMQAHLRRLNSESGRASAAILFFVPTIGEVAALYGDESASRLRQQMADWLSGLVRVEDIVGRAGSDEFVMLLPETSEDDADRVRRRVIGVLQQSEFRLTDNVPVGVEVYIQSALVALEPEDSLESLVKRASAALA